MDYIDLKIECPIVNNEFLVAFFTTVFYDFGILIEIKIPIFLTI